MGQTPGSLVKSPMGSCSPFCWPRFRVLGRCGSADRGQPACPCPGDPGQLRSLGGHPAPAPHLLQFLERRADASHSSTFPPEHRPLVLSQNKLFYASCFPDS